MATWETLPSFEKDYSALSSDNQKRFRKAVQQLASDLNHLPRPRAGLRIKRVQGAPPGVREMTWAPDGRATFQFGLEIKVGHAHVVWRRIGTHSILDNP